MNLPTAGWDVHHPFGGFRDSGSPFKEQGAPGLRFYTRIKTAAVRFAWWPAALIARVRELLPQRACFS